MRLLILGCLFDEKEECNLLHKSKTGLAGSVNTYQWNLIKGLDKNLKNPVDIINVLPVGIFPKYFKDPVLKTRRWSHLPGANDLEIGSLNFPIIKQLWRAYSCKKAIREWLKDSNDRIIIYSIYWPFLRAILSIPSDIKVTLVVTDLLEYYDLTVSKNLIGKLLRTIYNKRVYALLERIDSFVILTEQMEAPLGIGNRPYVVIEGIVDEDKNTIVIKTNQKLNKKVILYTGTLHYQFGIGNLLEAFSLIAKDDYELWICGTGEAELEIVKLSKRDNRIKYLGYVSKNQIYDLQQKATVLVNPRTNKGEYTKYSFPSKTMEYLLSGKPVIMYKLEGIPDEYDQYVYYLEDDRPYYMAAKIVEIVEQDQENLDAFGKKAREFVLKEKNCKVQAEKIVNMIMSASHT